MPSGNLTAKDELFKFLQETNSIYDSCKKYSILIEEILPRHKAPIHAANELKSLVFHLYKLAQSEISDKEIEENILEAKEHLCRAFYDLHSLLISIYIEQIKNKLSVYKDETISKVFPAYGDTMRPLIKRLQVELQQIRSNRNTDLEKINSNMPLFEQQTTTLARFDDIVESMKPKLNAHESKLNKKFIYQALLAIIIAVLIFGAGYYLASNP